MTHANSFARAAAPRTRSGKQHRQNHLLSPRAALPGKASQALRALKALRRELAPAPFPLGDSSADSCGEARRFRPSGRRAPALARLAKALGGRCAASACSAFLLLLALSRAASASIPDLSDATASGLSPEHEWGCKVLLCLADPRGPKAEPECRPPIDRLYEELRSRHPHFPTCPMAGDGNYAQPLLDPFDPCSLAGDGLEDAPEGYVAEGRRIELRPGRYRTEITKAPRMNTAGRDRGTESTFVTKACVKDPQGVYRWSEGWGDSEVGHTARLFGTVLWLEPQGSRAIDVFIDGTLWRRVRY